MDIKIQNASENDLDKILEISELNKIINVKDTSAGFLVSGYTKEQYLDYLTKADCFYVAIVDNEVVGVLLAFYDNKIQEDEIVNNIIKYSLLSNFILVKQIFVNPKFSSYGIAKKLYNHLFQNMSDNISFATVIVDKPFNHASVKFHKKIGYEKIMNITPNEDYDGVIRNRSVWYKKSKKDKKSSIQELVRITTNDTSETKNVLLANLQNTTTLYMHEDNLNWTKLGMLVTFVFALCAGFNHYYEKQDPTSIVLAFIVVILGFAISILFDKKIHSGLMYMKSHKDNLKAIEDKIQHYCPNYERVISVKNKKIANNSSTSNIMNIVPHISYTIWAILLLLLFLKLLN